MILDSHALARSLIWKMFRSYAVIDPTVGSLRSRAANVKLQPSSSLNKAPTSEPDDKK